VFALVVRAGGYVYFGQSTRYFFLYLSQVLLVI
jgi:hypothetical protein